MKLGITVPNQMTYSLSFLGFATGIPVIGTTNQETNITDDLSGITSINYSDFVSSYLTTHLLFCSIRLSGYLHPSILFCNSSIIKLIYNIK